MKALRAALVIVAGLTLAPDTPADDTDKADKKERQALIGSWAVTSMEMNGKTPPEEAIKEIEYVFTADRITRKMGGKVKSETGYRLDPAKMPKWIDLTDLTDKDKTTFPAVYEADKDTIKLCYRMDAKKSNQRAEKLDGGKGGDQVLMVLKRKLHFRTPVVVKDAGTTM